MKWTRTPPRKPGYYWAMAFECGNLSVPEVVAWWAEGDAVWRPGSSLSDAFPDYLWWYGPLDDPPFPE